jgi:serine/threonine protein kinase/sugar lactone lactonase YvrE
MALTAGAQLGRYEVHSLLGAGGMGEVYFAIDTILKRPVALKVLSPEFTSNKDRLRRFEQEARATSALNHPNILTIYDIGQLDSIYYMAAEFVDGTTLRQSVSQARLNVIEVLDVAVQIAAALNAAHQAGVVHRDIKPDNIMLRKDGIIKVLDFGLAKLLEGKSQQFASPEASTATAIDTDPGATVGTLAYMSPEQLRGQRIDVRTDIWSFGVVLYEMLTGRLPFDRPTRSDMIVSILEREPSPLSLTTSVACAELHRIVTKSLCKSLPGRYGSVKDLLGDLRRARRNFDLEVRQSPFIAPPSGGERVAADTAGERLAINTAEKKTHTNSLEDRPLTSGIGDLLDEVKLRRGVLIFLLAGTILIVSGVIYRQRGLSVDDKVVEPAQKMRFTPLATNGDVRGASISPDGKYVAYIAESGGRQSICIRQISTSSDIEKIAPSPEKYWGISFSRDGSYLYYIKQERGAGTLYQVPVIGGNERRLISNVGSTVTFSPDGKWLAFVRDHPKEGATKLIVASADGAAERELGTRTRPELFTLGGDIPSGPAWSPDGTEIACPVLSTGGLLHTDLVSVRVGDGFEHRIGNRQWRLMGQMAWVRDGRGLIVNALEPDSSRFQLWFLPYSGGEPRRITNDPNFYEALSLSADSASLVTLQASELSGIWVAPSGGAKRAWQNIPIRYTGSDGIGWTPDDKILYASNMTGYPKIWEMNSDGSAQRQLTFGDYADVEPDISRDGRHVCFVSYRTGQAHIWLMDSDGSSPRQLTNGNYEDSPGFSPDGLWVIYHSIEAGRDGLRRVRLTGGEPVTLTDAEAQRPVASPDGTRVACFLRDQPLSPWKLAIIPLRGGAPEKLFDMQTGVSPIRSPLRWTSDGRSLTYVVNSGGVSNLWQQPLDGGPATQITLFEEGQIYSFTLSPDGKHVACVRGSVVRDLVLINNFIVSAKSASRSATFAHLT